MVCYVNETAVYTTDEASYDAGVDGVEASVPIVDTDMDNLQGYIDALFLSESIDYPGCTGAAWDAAWGRDTGDPIRSEDFQDLRDRIDALHTILCCTAYCPTHLNFDYIDHDTGVLTLHYSGDQAEHYVNQNTTEYSPHDAVVEVGDQDTNYTGDQNNDNTTHDYDHDSGVQFTYNNDENPFYCGTHDSVDEDSHQDGDNDGHDGSDDGVARGHDSGMEP